MEWDQGNPHLCRKCMCCLLIIGLPQVDGARKVTNVHHARRLNFLSLTETGPSYQRSRKHGVIALSALLGSFLFPSILKAPQEIKILHFMCICGGRLATRIRQYNNDRLLLLCLQYPLVHPCQWMVTYHQIFNLPLEATKTAQALPRTRIDVGNYML